MRTSYYLMTSLLATAIVTGCDRNPQRGTTEPSATPPSTTSPATTPPSATPPSTSPSTSPSVSPSVSPSSSPTAASPTAAVSPSATPGTGGPGAGATPVAASAGQAVYTRACFACHGTGVAGAPKLGDKADWGPRIARGKDTLYQHAINGYAGQKGVMPPKGGNTALSDAEVRSGVDYMTSQAR